MKCQKCGADIPDGDVFCQKCGAEVQLVPDYNSVEYLLKQKQEKTKAAEAESVIENDNNKKKKKKKKHGVLITVLILLLLAGAVFGVTFFINKKNANSYDYQIEKAEIAYSNHDYEKATEYVKRAIGLDPDSVDAKLLLSQIYIDSDNTDAAVAELNEIIAADPDNTTAYGQLINVYGNESDVDSIKKLMDACTSEAVKEKFAAYICASPKITPAEGNYKYKLKVSIASASGEIHYTTDGSTPTKDSAVYSTPLQMEEGTTKVQAIVINEKGIPSDVVSATYKVTLPRPNPPVIDPESGTYDVGTEITVTVPSDCKAYYAFDATPTTSSTRYTKPIKLEEGEHIFSVIVVDANGKQSYPASETYVVN